MSSVYFNSLAGMMAASMGLRTVSNNVSNMQSPGFKGSNLYFESLGGGGTLNDSLGAGIGNGVGLGNSKINFQQGNLEQTGVNTQLAIDGQGFFIIQMKNGEYLYTRDGEFDFNDDGYLIDAHTQGFVMGIGEAGQLTKITENGPDTYPGKATSEVLLSGKIYYEEKKSDEDGPSVPDPGEPGTEKGKYETIKFTVDIYDEKGSLHHLNLTFSVEDANGLDPNIIHLQSVEENGAELYNAFGFPEYSIEFDSLGYPSENHAFDLSLSFGDSKSQKIRFDFGKGSDGEAKHVEFKKHEPGEFTEIEVNYQDGYAEGKLYGSQFDENGQIEYLYTNEQSNQGINIALARFDDPNAALKAVDNNAFRARSSEGLHIGQANEDAFGSFVVGKLELSNVDSTNEFANIVILQRMFQACSQMMEIDKQLLEDLYK